MSNRRIVDLYFDVESMKRTDSSAATFRDRIQVVMCSQVLFRATLKNASASAFALETGSAFTFSMSNVYGTSTTPLVYSDNSVFNLVADWADADPTAGKICWRANLNTTELAATMATYSRVVMHGEVWYAPPGVDSGPLFQFDLDVLNVVGSSAVLSELSGAVYYDGDKVVLRNINGFVVAEFAPPT